MRDAQAGLNGGGGGGECLVRGGGGQHDEINRLSSDACVFQGSFGSAQGQIRCFLAIGCDVAGVNWKETTPGVVASAAVTSPTSVALSADALPVLLRALPADAAVAPAELLAALEALSRARADAATRDPAWSEHFSLRARSPSKTLLGAARARSELRAAGARVACVSRASL